MAIKFNETKGEARKEKLDSYVYTGKEDHHVRLVGDLLPRYVYWVKGENGKNIPMECLAFDRNTETFNNAEKDHVQSYFPDLKCGWSYAIQCIDYGDNKVKIFNLKKKLFEQLTVAMEDLGDPTDYETGWDVFFKRKKTGPNAYNVEYQLQALKCKVRALNEDELSLVENLKSMDEVLPRPTPELQLDLLKKITQADDDMDDSISDEFDVA
jgi:hypothetical protein